MDEHHNTDADAMLDAGVALATRVARVEGDSRPYVLVPEGYDVRDLENTLARPTRHRGTVVLNDVTSFIAYVDRYSGGLACIYMQPPSGASTAPKFVAVLNEHGGEQAAWRDWRAIYEPTLSPEWLTWMQANGRSMSQVDFARFIEDNLPDVVDPIGATLLEVARSIEAKKKVQFGSAVRLSDGQTQLTYEEDIQGTAAKGQLAIPEAIVLAIPVLLNGPLYRVTARLRYRLDGAKLALWVDLLRPHEIMQHAVKEAREAIATGVSLPIFVGKPD